MEHVSNKQIIRVFKLFIEMEDFNAEYNPNEIYNHFEKSQSDNNAKVKAVQKTLEPLTNFAFHITKINSNFDSLYTLCIGSKQTQVVNYSKPITEVKKSWKGYILIYKNCITYFCFQKKRMQLY